MKKPSSIAWLGFVFCISVTVEILTWAMGASPEKSVARLLFLVGLFALLLKGFRFARYTLSVMYFLGGVLAFVSAVRADEQLKFVILFGVFSIFSVTSAGFFLRSNVLRALTAAKSSNAQHQ